MAGTANFNEFPTLGHAIRMLAHENQPKAKLPQKVLKGLKEATRLVYGTCVGHHHFTMVMGLGPVYLGHKAR